MAIIKVGKVFNTKFAGREEPRIEVALGGLPVTYSVFHSPKRPIVADDKVKLNLQLNEAQFQEINAAMLEALDALNEAGGFKATKKILAQALEQAVSASTAHEGLYRFYGSRKMGFMDKETNEFTPFNVPIYNGSVDAENLITGGINLGAGSIVRSTFILSLWRDKAKAVHLNINPNMVVVVSKVDPPKRDSISHDGLDDSSSYDY